MDVLAAEVPHRDLYNLLISCVGPRPIAWVSSVSAAGQPNLAPFSFFNCVCGNPPVLAFAPSLRPPNDSAPTHGEPKDTLRNIRETGEFVISVVTYHLRTAMNLTSGEYDATVNEFELAGLSPQPSAVVRPPRVGESPVSFECQLHQILDFSTGPTGGSLVIGQVVAIHVDEAHCRDGRIDRDSLDLIGRLGGIQYTRTRERFEMARPKLQNS